MVAVAVLSFTSVFATTVSYMDPATEVFDRVRANATPTIDVTNPSAAMLAPSSNLADYTSSAVPVAAVAIPALDKNDAASLLWSINGGQSQLSILRVEVLRKTQQDPSADAPEIMTLVMIGSGLALFSMVKLGRRRRSHADDYRAVLKRTAIVAASRG